LRRHRCFSSTAVAHRGWDRLPASVRVVEVGARDGLQNEKTVVDTAKKIEFINRLSGTGLRTIEATAFVSPKWVPQMGDHKEVMAGIDRRQGVTYPVLVPNLKGYEAARAAGATEVNIFTAATESFCQKNINCSIDESFDRFRPIFEHAAADGIRVRGSCSVVLGCPYEGAMEPSQVVPVVRRLLEAGCYEVSLGDTLGVGTAGHADRLLQALSAEGLPFERLAMHCHDTYGQALANILTALQYGIAVIDSSTAGLGGCPYCKGALGNVATEDVLYMLHGLGIHTGVDLDGVIDAGAFMSEVLGRPSVSRAAKALLTKRGEGG